MRYQMGRAEGESFEEYKERRTRMNKGLDRYMKKGHQYFVSKPVIEVQTVSGAQMREAPGAGTTFKKKLLLENLKKPDLIKR